MLCIIAFITVHNNVIARLHSDWVLVSNLRLNPCTLLERNLVSLGLDHRSINQFLTIADRE